MPSLLALEWNWETPPTQEQSSEAWKSPTLSSELLNWSRIFKETTRPLLCLLWEPWDVHGLIRKVVTTSKLGAWSPKPLAKDSWAVVNGSLDHTGLLKKGQRSDFSLKNICVLNEQDFLKFIKLGVSRLFSCFFFLLPLLPLLLLS